MKYLLDTNAAISLLRDSDSRVAQRIRTKTVEDVYVSLIAVYELYFGAFKGSLVDWNLRAMDAFELASLEFNREDARVAGEIRAFLARQGTPIGPYDLLIAGQAKARDLVLVTHNTREFRRVPGLIIEDWED